MSDPAFQPTHITPSAEQLAIQLLKTRLLLVEANAGAAKTTTLALRIAQALQRGAQPVEEPLAHRLALHHSLRAKVRVGKDGGTAFACDDVFQP